MDMDRRQRGGKPHYLLFSEAQQPRRLARKSCGRWHFVLDPVGRGAPVEAWDFEPGMRGERLELLAVIRGLEALEQPSRVTLVTTSCQVQRGVRFGLPEWRGNGWRWERFGRLVPIKNRDLWRRLDRALEIHSVECRTWRLDGPAQVPPRPRLRGACSRAPVGRGLAACAGQFAVMAVRKLWQRLGLAGRRSHLPVTRASTA